MSETRKYSKRISHDDWVSESIDVLFQYDFPITLRQLFYVLVSRGFIKKTENRYKSLSGHLADARKRGEISWDSIVDYTREVIDIRAEYITITQQYKNLIKELNTPYELPRHYGQEDINLFFLEKDSLKPFIEPFLYPNSLLVIGKGQNSWSNGYELSKMDMYNSRIHLYTLVDYDLSGIYIHNSFVDQLNEFNIEVVEIKNLAITEEQISEYHLERDPEKNEVQLQALDPLVLRDLILRTCDQNWSHEIDQKRAELQKEMNKYYRKKVMKIYRKEVI